VVNLSVTQTEEGSSETRRKPPIEFAKRCIRRPRVTVPSEAVKIMSERKVIKYKEVGQIRTIMDDVYYLYQKNNEESSARAVRPNWPIQ
jgi:hypothetical protein